MSMAGRMSERMRRADSQPAIMIKSENTATVYGRRSASLTIHIGRYLRQRRTRAEPKRSMREPGSQEENLLSSWFPGFLIRPSFCCFEDAQRGATIPVRVALCTKIRRPTGGHHDRA